MKKLNKLPINSEKLLENEELMTLRGGYGGPCTCGCWNWWTLFIYGYLVSASGDCHTDCRYAFEGTFVTGECEN